MDNYSQSASMWRKQKFNVKFFLFEIFIFLYNVVVIIHFIVISSFMMITSNQFFMINNVSHQPPTQNYGNNLLTFSFKQYSNIWQSITRNKTKNNNIDDLNLQSIHSNQIFKRWTFLFFWKQSVTSFFSHLQRTCWNVFFF